MPGKFYRKCQAIMANLKPQEAGAIVSLDEVKNSIMQEIGGDNRTLKLYFGGLASLKFLKRNKDQTYTILTLSSIRDKGAR